MRRGRDARNPQQSLLMHMRSDLSAASHPNICVMIIMIENCTAEEFQAMFRVLDPVFSAIVTKFALTCNMPVKDVNLGT
jgi:hypothetical protein